MTAIDTPPPLWVPPKPAIIRPAEHSLLRPGAFRPCSREERGAMVADLVRTRRLTPAQAKRAMFFVPVVGWSTQLPFSFTYTTYYEDLSTPSTNTWSSCSLGDDVGSGNQRITLVHCMWVEGSSRTLNSASIAGVSATMLSSTHYSNVFSQGGMFAADTTGQGTTGDIVVSWSSTVYYAAVGIVSIINPVSGVTPYASTKDVTHSNGLIDLSMSIPAGAGVFGGSGSNNSSTTFTWTGATEVANDQFNSGNRYSYGVNTSAAGGSPQTITIQQGDTTPGDHHGAAVAYVGS